MKMSRTSIPPKTLICTLRVAPSFYAAVAQAVRDTGDPTVRLWQGQAKTYADGTINPSLFVQDDFDDHPGKPLSPAEKIEIQQMLRDPSYRLHIVNSVAGNNASDRALAGIYALMHADLEYRARGGVSAIAYDLLYDGDGRNDKIHTVEHTDASGATRKISEDNAPSGVYGPQIYQRAGADSITVFDPHSKKHEDNLKSAFGRAGVALLSNLELIAANIVQRHHKALLDGRFRIGAPDGWDKKDDPERNAAIERVKTVTGIIWAKMPELHAMYRDEQDFLTNIQFGIVKAREAAYPGAPAKPKFKTLVGNILGCDCELLDDLADSGGSLIQSGTALLENGARRVDASICHGPASVASLQRILHDTCALRATGAEEEKISLVISHLTITNTMARVEGFHGQLEDKDKKRTTLLNCADRYIAHLAATPPKPEPQGPTVFGLDLGRILRR